MGGLLYKDYVSSKGKIQVFTILIFVGLFVAMRLCVRSNGWFDAFNLIVENEDGSIVDVSDILAVMVLGSLLVLFFQLINQMIPAIVEDDRKYKMINYIQSLPVDRNTYLASKYVYILIWDYVILSVYFITSIICKAFCSEGIMLELALSLDQFALMFACFILFCAAVELPLMLCLGKAKTMFILTMILMAFALCIIGYLLFGDISIFSRIDYRSIIGFFKKYADVIAVINFLSPVIVLLIYYGSYKIVCKKFVGEAE